MANQGPGAMAMMAKAYTGNGPSNEWDYFNSLYRMLSSEDLNNLGANTHYPMITSYVDGSYDYYMEEK